MKPIRVVVADDHPLFRRGLISLLEDAPEVDVVGEAADASQAVALVNQTQPDVVLMDVIMPGSGVEATRTICQTMPHIKVLMLTASEDNENLFSAIDAGANGYLLKEGKPEELLEAIQHVYGGQSVLSPAVAAKVLERMRQNPLPKEPAVAQNSLLTPREMEIIHFLAQGLTNQEIAQALDLAENTIKNHVRNILRKTHVRNRAGLVTWAIQRGLIDEAT